MERKVLFIDACARKESRTRVLAEYLLPFLDGQAEKLELYKEGVRPLDEDALIQRENDAASGACGGKRIRYARQFAAADDIVIAAPHWDLSFPAILKAYIENINVIGITFAYDGEGNPYGLCRAENLYYVVTSGGRILEGDAYGFGYIKALCKRFYGIGNVKAFYAENLDIVGSCSEEILEKTRLEMDGYFIR